MTSEEPAVVAYGKYSAGHILRTWKLRADLVTLSACQTGLGEYQGGEGYVGFSQALFLAGAQTLVLSQWPAQDWSTALFMERFYENLLGARPGLQAPMSKVEALAEAKSYLRRLDRQAAIDGLKTLQIPFEEGKLVGDQPFTHPFYWAPFILIGDPGK